MSDFEVHQIGTATELRLSRELVTQIHQVTEQYGAGIFPQNVIVVYNELIKHYNKQMDNERYTNGI